MLPPTLLAPGEFRLVYAHYAILRVRTEIIYTCYQLLFGFDARCRLCMLVFCDVRQHTSHIIIVGTKKNTTI